jgi:hypothetical protein
MNPSPEQIAEWRETFESKYTPEELFFQCGEYSDRYIQHDWQGYLRRCTEQATEIAALKDDLQFVERWAVHHGTKSHMTPENALSVIQHYPAITTITKSYVDGKVPDTFNPYAQIAALKAQIAELMPLAKFGAIVLRTYKEGYVSDEELGNFALTSKCVMQPFEEYAPNVEATITKILKD